MRIGRLNLKLQIACGDGYAIGPGKADLLDAIVREGSISGAARALGMSYRRAWLLVDEMNRCFRDPLVETVAGRGGGATLSAAGRAVLADYRALDRRLAEAAGDAAYTRLADALRDTPLPPRSGPAEV